MISIATHRAAKKPTDGAVGHGRNQPILVMSRKRLVGSEYKLHELQTLLVQWVRISCRSVSLSKVSRAVFPPCAAHAAGAGWSVSWLNFRTALDGGEDLISMHHLRGEV